METFSTNTTDLEAGFTNGLAAYALLMTELIMSFQRVWMLVKPSRNNGGISFDDFVMSSVFVF